MTPRTRTKCTRPPATDQHVKTNFVQDDERDRIIAGAIIRTVFPHTDVLGEPFRYPINRARNNSTCNWWYRARRSLRHGVRVGIVTSERLMLLVTDLLTLHEELFGDVSPGEWRKLSHIEQRLDNEEASAQLRLHDDLAYAKAYIEKAKASAAAQYRLIAALERAVAERGQAKEQVAA